MEADLLAPPTSAAVGGYTGGGLAQPHKSSIKSSGGGGGGGGGGGDGGGAGGWFWFGSGGGGNPTPAKGSSGSGKQRPADERVGWMDEREMLAIERRRTSDWGAEAHGAITDPTRFQNGHYYSPHAAKGGGGGAEFGYSRTSRAIGDTASYGGHFLTDGESQPLTNTARGKLLQPAQRRQMWINSSRRWVESMKAKGALSPHERKVAQSRLYQPTARSKATPRVYC